MEDERQRKLPFPTMDMADADGKRVPYAGQLILRVSDAAREQFVQWRSRIAALAAAPAG